MNVDDDNDDDYGGDDGGYSERDMLALICHFKQNKNNKQRTNKRTNERMGKKLLLGLIELRSSSMSRMFKLHKPFYVLKIVCLIACWMDRRMDRWMDVCLRFFRDDKSVPMRTIFTTSRSKATHRNG